ncbi:MAG TPA: J domain-containing protein [Terracidiphilus sp.]|nr:J domain-containing protein [Terracidiphilus sp.]
MKLCVCGNSTDDSGTLCPRCAALQSLELKIGATGEEIKAAYHLLVKVWHPDRFANDATLKAAADEKLKAINAAYLLLTSTSAKETRKRWSPRAAGGRARSKPAVGVATVRANPEARTRTGTIRRIILAFAALGAVQRLVLLCCAVGASAFFAKLLDSQMASDPATAHVYMEYRQAIAQEIHSSRTRIFDQMQHSLRAINPFRSPSAAAPPVLATQPTIQPAPPTPTPTAHASKKPQRPTLRLLPYITVGLTRDEVTAIAGQPDSATDNSLAYKGAKIDLKDGVVSGWKIDPIHSALRVKLWPDAPVDTTQHYFGVGATKNDVLAIQGTPTSFTEDEFGYGASEVYFQNNRVVRWKDDPSSVPLRVVSR